jgi:putative DNA methylase
MTYRKKLIEVALPLEAINVASAREKSIRHGHPSTLHLWWARRPLAACRAVIFTSLVDDPDDPEAPPDFVAACRALPKGKNAAANDTPRQRLFDFIERLVTWEATTDEKILKTARELILLATDGNPPPLLDPFAGGGSIPLEAQRLGLEAHASDLNPVAVMINKALIEIPPKFANCPPVNPRDRQKVGGTGHWKGAAGLAADVRYYGEWMRERAWERIGHLYPKHEGETVIAWLWARTVKCPNPACGTQMPLVRSFDLSKKKGKAAWVEPQVGTESRQLHFTVKQASKGNGPEGTVNRQGAACLACKTAVPFDYIRAEGKAGRMSAQLMAIVSEGQSGRNYHAPTPKNEAVAQVAIPVNAPDTDLPEQALSFRVQLYGMTKHRHLFTPRQLVALTTFSGLVAEAREQILADAHAAGLPDDDIPLRDGGTSGRAYAEAVSIYLAFALDKMTTTNSSICTWQTNPTRLVAAFSRQAIPMVWDFAEANPFSNAAGDYSLAIDSLTRVVDNLLPVSHGQAIQQDATLISLGKKFLISTDPPYYDNIGYADLSDYFYAWLRINLRGVFPHIFSTLQVPKEAELIATPFRFAGSKEQANKHFELGLQQAFERSQQICSNIYPLTIFYAFKQSEIVPENNLQGTSNTGWETMLAALIGAGFMVSGTWPMRTELTVALKASVNALASSIVLVCRPRPENAPVTARRDFVNALRLELPAALREMQSGNIAPVDLAQASIGPGMAVYSRYSKVLEPNGDRLTVRAALQLINQVLDEFLAETEGDLDPDSRFAVAWFEQYGFKSGDFGVADVLARAKNTSVDGLRIAGVLTAGAGSVRLLSWEELDPGWDPAADPRLTVWEATHHLIERLHSHGEEGAAMLLAKMPPDLAAAARQLAYRLYSICERKSWADLARDYNALVISWSSSQERAVELKTEYQQQRLFK